MPKKEISWILKARDSVTGVLRRVGKRFRKFGRMGKSIARKFALGFGAVTAALGAAAWKAQEFNKRIAEVATLTSMSRRVMAKNIRMISAEFGLAKDALTKGLYDALSAGVPEGDVFDYLRTAARMARAGATSTAEAVDLLTTAMNAYSIPAEQAAQVSDALFKTVKLGKTTVAELAASFSKVAPLAASTGVSIEEVLAAVASLTKQGTPTAMAMTQIRGALLGVNKTLGDGWQKTMTLQEAFVEMQNRAGGSATALRTMTGRVEGALAIMAMTGDKTRGAARDLKELQDTVGATGRAFDKFADVTPLDKLYQSIMNIVIAVGDTALQLFGPTLEKAGRAAARLGEKIADWADTETFRRLKKDIDGMVEALSSGSDDDRKLVLEASGEVIKASFAVAAETAANILAKAAPRIGAIIGAGIKSVAKNIWDKDKDEIQAAEELGLPVHRIHGPLRPTIRWGGYTKEEEKQIRAKAREMRISEKLKEMGIDQKKETKNQTVAQVELNQAVEAWGRAIEKVNSKRKKGAEETKNDAEDAKEEKPLPKPEPEPEGPPGMAEDVEKKIGSLKMQIRLQELLNKGKTKEAELLRVQQSLGRDLTEQERERLGAEIDRLNALKGEQEAMSNLSKAISVDPGQIGTSLAQIGGMIGAGGVENREAVQLDKRRNSTLDSINSNIRRLEFDMEMT